MGDGAFVKQGPQVWAAIDKATGKLVRRYREVGNPNPSYTDFPMHVPWGVVLYEPQSEVGLRLNLFTRKVQLAPHYNPINAEGTFTDFRDIVNVSNQSIIPGINRDWWQNESVLDLETFGGFWIGRLRMVDIGRSAFVRTAPLHWVEVDKASGQATHSFVQIDYPRGAGIIMLLDYSRKIGLRFRLGPMKAELRTGLEDWMINQPFGFFANIVAVSNYARVPGVNRDWTGYEFGQAAAPSAQAGPTPAQPGQVTPQTGVPPGKVQFTWRFRNRTGEPLFVKLSPKARSGRENTDRSPMAPMGGCTPTWRTAPRTKTSATAPGLARAARSTASAKASTCPRTASRAAIPARAEGLRPSSRSAADRWLFSYGKRMPAKGAWKSLAHQIGVSPEALYRELARRRTG